MQQTDKYERDAALTPNGYNRGGRGGGCLGFYIVFQFSGECIVGRKTLKNVAPQKQNAICKRKAQFSQNTIALLNYLKHIAP